MKTYYLLGQTAVNMYEDGHDIEEIVQTVQNGDGAAYEHDESAHSSNLVDAMDGWYAAATITKELFDKINAKP